MKNIMLKNNVKHNFVSKEVMKSMIIFGDSQNMKEVKDESVHLVVTSPPYFNAPFDYPNLFESYTHFLDIMKNVASEIRRVLKRGRIVCLVVDDVLIDGEKYPVVADITRIFMDLGFKYRDRIVWVKPEGYIRISRRSGVLLQNPYPMYYYPDNIQESILIFQKGNFDYNKVEGNIKEFSKIDITEYQKNKWYLNVWNITNVLPNNNRLEKGIAAFPEEIPYRLIKLFSYRGEVVLDPFMGSGTTLKVAIQLGRHAIGYDIDRELIDVVKKKLGIQQPSLINNTPDIEIIIREDSKNLRTMLQARIQKTRSVKMDSTHLQDISQFAGLHRCGK